MKKEKLIFVTIILLAAVLRFWKLGSTPPSLYWDEVSLGYNAYSILKTGRDEHGERLPIARFIAFGDYKPPGYIYAAVPAVALFGLTEFAVRFPSALAGTLTVLLTYFLVKELFQNEKWKMDNGKWKISPPAVALLAAMLLAISPWHLQFSRAAFEANLATFFSLMGVYFFLKGLKNGKFLVLSFSFFAISTYTFNTHRVFLPVFILALVLVYHRVLRSQWRNLIAATIVMLVLIAPQIPFLLSREGQLRFQEVTIFRDLDPIVRANQRIARDGNSLWARVIHNRRLQYILEFAKHYVDNLRPDFLFFSGDINPRLGTRDQGLLYPIELPLIAIGIYTLIKRKQQYSLLLALWWLLGIIPAATARETPHALRTMNILPVPQVIAAVGITAAFQIMKRKRLGIALLAGFYLVMVVMYLHTYLVHYPKRWAASWQYGYKQLVAEVFARKPAYDRIFVTTKYGRPYIYFLFFGRYPPQVYWQTREAERDWFGFWTVSGIENIRFADPLPKDPTNQERWLVVSGPDGLPEKSSALETIRSPNGEVVFELGEL